MHKVKLCNFFHHVFAFSFVADDDNDSIAETNPNDRDKMETDEKQCPLCQENFTSQESLNEHALSVHSVNAEGLARLQSLINGSHWLANKKDDKENSKKDEDLTNHSSEERGKFKNQDQLEIIHRNLI